MKPHDTHTHAKGGCCREPETQNPTSCCQESTIDATCCKEWEMQEGCCRESEGAYETTCCCKESEEEDAANGPPSLQGEDVVHHSEVRIAELEQLLTEANDKYVRLYSEFENFKRRSVKERMELADKANEKALKELLPVVDDFERSITVLQVDNHPVQQAIQEGVKLIYDKLSAFLKKYGVQELVIAHGSEFDAELHEAVMQQPVEELDMKGKVISVVEKGYLINDYVLRFAKVVIGV